MFFLLETNSLHFLIWQISTCPSGPLNVIPTGQASLTPQTELCTPIIHSHSTRYFSVVTLSKISCVIVCLSFGLFTRLKAPWEQGPCLPCPVPWTVQPRNSCSRNIYWTADWMTWPCLWAVINNVDHLFQSPWSQKQLDSCKEHLCSHPFPLLFLLSWNSVVLNIKQFSL